MANKPIKVVRVSPRTLAAEFYANKNLTIMVTALLLQVVMTLVTVGQGILQGQEMYLTVLSGVMLLFLAYLTYAWWNMRQMKNEKAAKSAARATIVYFTMLMLYALFMATLIYSMHTVLASGEIVSQEQYDLWAASDKTDSTLYLTQSMLDEWNATLPMSIVSIVIQFMEAIAYGFMFRSLNDVKELSRGKYPDRNASTLSAVFCALAAGVVLCDAATSVMASADIASSAIAILSLVPTFIFFLCGSQLFRRLSMRRAGDI